MTGSSCRRLRWHREDTEAPSDEAGVAPRGRHGAATDVAARTPWQAVATTAPVMTSGCRVMLKDTRGAEKPRPTCKPRHTPSPCKCTCREASKIQCHASTCSTKEQAALQDSSALRIRGEARAQTTLVHCLVFYSKHQRILALIVENIVCTLVPAHQAP